MIQVIQPEWSIHVGVKNGEIVSTDWGELNALKPELSGKRLKRTVIRALKKAAKGLEKAKV